MGIAIDGRKVATRTVDKKELADHSFTVTLAAGVHRITVAFLSDANVPDPNNGARHIEDRNLYLVSIQIQPPALAKPEV